MSQQSTKKTQPRPSSGQPTKKDQPSASGNAPQSQIKRSNPSRQVGGTARTVPRQQPVSSGLPTPIIVGGVLVAVLVLGFLVITLFSGGSNGGNNFNNANQPLGKELTFNVSGAGVHRTTPIDYATVAPNVVPPVGGPHNPQWMNCGIYDKPLNDANAVHDLEHGAVWITYQPNLDSSVVNTLRGIVGSNTYLLLSPYNNLPAPIVASAWGGGGKTGYQMRLNPGQYDLLNQFIAKHRDGTDAPEHGAACTGGIGTPLQ